jgi:hypothetical protein
VDTVLGLLAFCLFVTAVIALAASVSWLVAKLTPMPGTKPDKSQPTP